MKIKILVFLSLISIEKNLPIKSIHQNLTDYRVLDDFALTVCFFSLSCIDVKTSSPGLMKDHDQQARASENFAGPVDFERPRPD